MCDVKPCNKHLLLHRLSVLRKNMLKPHFLIYVFIFLINSTSTNAQEASSPAKANEIFNNAKKLYGMNAVEETGFVSIGGIKQWVSVRGQDKENPILLFLHGGPGFTVSPVSYFYMRHWEEYFTVVQWDQRGAGKTYVQNSSQTEQSFNVDTMVGDAEELVNYLRKKYKKKKIILMGHSFGSLLGVKLAQKRPESCFFYFWIGEFKYFNGSEKYLLYQKK
jgi:proline iminopeptidase